MKCLTEIALAIFVHHRLLAAEGTAFDASLFNAIRNGDAKGIAQSIQRNGAVNSRDHYGNSPLHLAALNLDLKIVARLVNAGANPNATNIWGDTPLIYSAGSLVKVQFLLRNGTDVNAQATNGTTALSAAGAFHNSFPVVRLLLESGAKLNTKQPLEIRNAVVGGDVKTVKLLLARGALVTSDSPDPSESPMVLAAVYDNAPILQALAEKAGSTESARVLLSAALHWAGFGQKVSSARCLLSSGADFRSPFSAWDSHLSRAAETTPLHWSAYNERDDPQLARVLLQNGLDVNAVNDVGETALDWADKRGHRQIIATLTGAGAKTGSRPPKFKQIPNRNVPTAGPTREELTRASIQRALALMERSSDAFLNSGSPKAQNCVSCHHQSMTSLVANLANTRGILPDVTSLRNILDATMSQLEPEIPKCYEGIPPAPNPAIEGGYMLMLLDALGHPADAVTDALVWQLAASQNADGSWPWTFSRPPLEHGHIKATGLAVKALATYSPPSRRHEFDRRIKAAKFWLKNAKPDSPTEQAFQLLGLAWAGEKSQATTASARAILAAQQTNGGWGSLPTLESDAWMTGLNLVALHEAGGVKTSDPIYKRGVDFLLRTQFEDGSWYVRSRTLPAQVHFDSHFPHGRDQFISAAGTGWAAMALLLTLDTAGEAPSLRAQIARQGPVVAVDSQVSARPDGTATTSFKKDIVPILARSCTGCHGGKSPAAGLNAETLSGLLRGGQSLNPAVVPGHADLSQVIRFVRDQAEDLEMPPLTKRSKFPQLTETEIEKLSLWIDQGAPQ